VKQPDAPRCEAKSKRSGERCKAYAVRGTDPARCRHHAGKRLSLIRTEVAVRQDAAAILRREGSQPVDDPLSVLASLAGDALAWRDACSALVDRLDVVRYQGAGGEQLRAEVALLERATDRAVRIVESMARLGIDERLARIRGLQAERVVRALDVTLSSLDVTDDVRDLARQRLVRELAR